MKNIFLDLDTYKVPTRQHYYSTFGKTVNPNLINVHNSSHIFLLHTKIAYTRIRNLKTVADFSALVCAATEKDTLQTIKSMSN